MNSLHSITVAELKRLLDHQDDHAMVIFSADYGDRCHTMQALPLRGEVEEVAVCESGYSESGFAIDDRDEEDHDSRTQMDADGVVTFLVIR